MHPWAKHAVAVLGIESMDPAGDVEVMEACVGATNANNPNMSVATRHSVVHRRVLIGVGSIRVL